MILNINHLKGCINDVELQRHLFIHRFGFNPRDIYTLTDEQATRQEIRVWYWRQRLL
ncbi:MAG: caspase family protein [Symploca sp. SIO2C1]|nr:caspase family protein [Symploca sp. SIO2C1]